LYSSIVMPNANNDTANIEMLIKSEIKIEYLANLM
jgi:hypothetical protein